MRLHAKTLEELEEKLALLKTVEHKLDKISAWYQQGRISYQTWIALVSRLSVHLED